MVQFAIKRMNSPDPFFLTVERLYQCLAFIYQPEPTYFISLSQVAQERKLINIASKEPFGNIVQIKVLKSIQKDFSGYIYIKTTNAVFFFSHFCFSLAFSVDFFCLSIFDFLFKITIFRDKNSSV